MAAIAQVCLRDQAHIREGQVTRGQRRHTVVQACPSISRARGEVGSGDFAPTSPPAGGNGRFERDSSFGGCT